MFDFIKKLVYLVVFVFVIYSGVMFGMPYYRYYAFKTDAADIARFQYKGRTDEEKISQMKAALLEKAEALGVPIGEKHIDVERTETGYLVTIQWQETVDLLGQYQKTLPFEIEVGG